MKRLQRQLPYPLTDQDKGFMQYLMAGVRRKREEASTRKPTPGGVSTPCDPSDHDRVGTFLCTKPYQQQGVKYETP